MTNWRDIDQKAKQWVSEAGEIIRQSFKTTLSITTKSNPNDLVTNMDKEIERFFIQKINETFPDHRVLGEEGQGDQIDSTEGVIWIIDPIDGTMNFVHQQRNFAISVGVYGDGIGQIGLIYDIVHDELYHAFKGNGAYMNDLQLPMLEDVELSEAVIGLNATWVMENHRIDHQLLTPLVKAVRGTRSYGSAALEFAYVASGRIDAYLTMRLSPWDFAAGLVILDEVGAGTSTVEGETIHILSPSSVLVGRKNIHTKILKNYLNV